MTNAGSHPQDRLFFTMMVGTGIIGSAIVILSLYVLTASLDRHASESGNKRLSLLLNDWSNTLTLSVEEYAFGDVVYNVVTNGDDEAIKLHLDTKKDVGANTDWFAIVDSDANIIFDLNLPENWGTASVFGSEEYQAALDQIVQSHPSEGAPLTGVFEHNGTRFLAAATQMMPDTMSGVDIDALPFFISGRNLDARALDKIALTIGSNNVSFSDVPNIRSVQLDNPLGSAGFLTWDTTLPGLQFRQTALPWVSLICAVFVMLTAWMANYFRRLATNLEKMHRVATTDQLTGVANRAALKEFLQSSSAKEALKQGDCAVISLDLNDFKHLNDELGHQAGDKALKISAERIKESLRQNDKVIRMGGDEFVCLLFDPNPIAAAQNVVARLENSFILPMNLGRSSQVVTPSIGIAISNRNDEWDAILERSDAAMYRAKRGQFRQKPVLG